jgi:hypothetical protein
MFRVSLTQRFLTFGPRTPGGPRRLIRGPRLFRKLNNFSQQIYKVFFVKKQNLKLKVLKRSVKVMEF